jgi:hypothetical protein
MVAPSVGQAKVRSKALKLTLKPTVAASVTLKRLGDDKDLTIIGSGESCKESSTEVSFDLSNVLPFLDDAG